MLSTILTYFINSCRSCYSKIMKYIALLLINSSSLLKKQKNQFPTNFIKNNIIILITLHSLKFSNFLIKKFSNVILIIFFIIIVINIS